MTLLPTTDTDTEQFNFTEWMKFVPKNSKLVSTIPFEPHLINSFCNFKIQFNYMGIWIFTL